MANSKAAAEKPTETTEIPDTLFVQDTTCVAGFEADGKTPLTRTHAQIVDMDGAEIEMPFTFTYGKKTEMATGVAMKFLKTAEFIVTDHSGKRIPRTPDQPDEHSRKPFVLRDEQVVADLAELSDDALWKRCQQTKGGEKLGRDAGRGRMVTYLTEARRAEIAARRGPGDPRLSKDALGSGGMADAPGEE